MFKSAATKIAHNSTIPALAGNNDLKLLQDVITSEKAVLQSLSKLSSDFTKSSEALRSWGAGEGEDLADTLSACATLMAHYSSSLSSFANHTSHIRECLKAVRTREEALDETHRRRKSLLAKADSAEKKLNRMNTDHKNFRQQTDILLSLREQIRAMDVEILDEEATLGDWKRVKAREWMAVLFGGLLECSEKGYVVATVCRSIISHIPLDQTEPGLARVPYSGHAQVEKLLVEAERELHEITFVGELKPDPATKLTEDQPDPPSPVYRLGELPGGFPLPPSSPPDQEHAQSPYPMPKPNVNNASEFGMYGESRGSYSLGPSHNGKTLASGDLMSHPPDRHDESGFSPISSKFSTFSTIPSPRATDSAFSSGHQQVPSQGSRFSGSSSAAKDRGPQPIPNANEQSFSSSVVAALGSEWKIDGGAPHLDVSSPRGFYQQTQDLPPSYIPVANLPPGAAAGVSPGNPDIELHRHLLRRPEAPRDDHSSHEELGLAYMSQDDNGEVDGGRRSREDKRVRFSGARDIDMDVQRRDETAAHDRNEEEPPSSPLDVSQQRNSGAEPPQPATSPQPAPIVPPSPPPPPPLLEPAPSPSRNVEQEEFTSELPLPSPPDENSLNALAAREISKQMDSTPRHDSALGPPSLPFASRRSVSPRPSVTADMPQSPLGKEVDRVLSRSGQTSPQIYERPVSREEGPLAIRPKLPGPPSYDRSGVLSPTSVPSSPDSSYYNSPDYLSNGSANRMRSSSNSRVSPVITTSPVSYTPPTSATTKTISAAAFRRPNMRFGGSSTSLPDGGVADVSPLNVRKRNLPAVPSVASGGGPRSQPSGSSGYRTFTTPVNQGLSRRTSDEANERIRSSSTSKVVDSDSSVLDEDYDYISAYVDDGRRQSQVANGDGSG